MDIDTDSILKKLVNQSGQPKIELIFRIKKWMQDKLITQYNENWNPSVIKMKIK